MSVTKNDSIEYVKIGIDEAVRMFQEDESTADEPGMKSHKIYVSKEVSTESSTVAYMLTDTSLTARGHKRMTFMQRIHRNATVFDKIHEMFRSKSFTVHAANELHKAYCTLEGCEYIAIDEQEKEKIACAWAPIPAADAIAHQIAFQTRLRKFSGLQQPDNMYHMKLTDQEYETALKTLTMEDHLSPEEILLAVNCAHLAYRSGLPFRNMTNSHYGPLQNAQQNKPFTYLSDIDCAKSWAQISKGAKLIATYLDVLHSDAEQRNKYDVFLGGSW
jgi:hypothetical protein